MSALAILPLVLLLQIVPPPLGRVVSVYVLGSAFGGADDLVSVPLPSAEDCHCGVPSSPRGPR